VPTGCNYPHVPELRTDRVQLSVQRSRISETSQRQERSFEVDRSAQQDVAYNADVASVATIAAKHTPARSPRHRRDPEQAHGKRLARLPPDVPIGVGPCVDRAALTNQLA
jgi:hypothetical protein